MFTKSFATLCALSVVSLVSAHGNVDGWNIGGQWTDGYLPYQDQYKNPVPQRSMRKIPGNGPVEDITSIDIQCNGGAEPAALVQNIAAGETIDLHWTTWPDSHKGPVITYLAAAPSDITKWSPGTDAVWFKIDEAGYENGKWAGTDILNSQNSTWPVKIPANLKAGQYLLRHEIIALHSAGSYPGAQFYPACVQLEVTGSGSAVPTKGLVAFPGGYTPEESTFNIYNGFTEYPIPGPALWDGTSDTIGGGSSAPASSTAAAPTSAAATSAPAATSSAAVTSSAAPVETSAPAETSVVETSTPAETSAPVETETSIAVEPSSTVVVPSSAAVTSVAATSAPTVTSVAVTSTSAAALPGSTAITDANVCMNNYNKCIAASQPKPDWSGCTATKDACLVGARYQRLRRSGTLGRVL